MSCLQRTSPTVSLLLLLFDDLTNSVPVIEDFFRLSSDAVRYYPKKCISSSLAVPIFSAALSALTLQQVDPLIATLHYFRDLFGFAFDKPLVSEFTSPEGEPYTNPPEVREAVKGLIASQGQPLAERVLTGMMFTFPGDCFPDASGVMMTLFELLPQETGAWLQTTLQMLPAGTMKPGEAERLLKNISDKVQSGETRKIRVLLQGGSSLPPLLADLSNRSRLHQLVSPPERRPTGRTGPPGGDPVPLQRMSGNLSSCTLFLLSGVFGPTRKQEQKPPPEHLHIRCWVLTS